MNGYEEEGLAGSDVSAPTITIGSEADFDQRLRELATLDSESDRLTAELKELNARKEALGYRLAQYMLDTGCSRKTLDGITYTQRQRVFSKVEDKEALRQWIIDNEATDLLMAVHASKLTAYCNEQLELGNTVPAGVNPNYIQYKVSIKRG